jgi:hypothetical protein
LLQVEFTEVTADKTGAAGDKNAPERGGHVAPKNPFVTI